MKATSGLEEKDLFLCKLCGERRKNLVVHLIKKHNITPTEYLEKFPGSKVVHRENYVYQPSKSNTRSYNMQQQDERAGEEKTTQEGNLLFGFPHQLSSIEESLSQHPVTRSEVEEEEIRELVSFKKQTNSNKTTNPNSNIPFLLLDGSNPYHLQKEEYRIQDSPYKCNIPEKLQLYQILKKLFPHVKVDQRLFKLTTIEKTIVYDMWVDFLDPESKKCFIFPSEWWSNAKNSEVQSAHINEASLDGWSIYVFKNLSDFEKFIRQELEHKRSSKPNKK